MAERWRDVCGVRIAPGVLRFTDAVPGSSYRAALTVQNLRAGACHLRLLPPQEPQFKLIVENPEKLLASGLQVKAVVEYTPKCAENHQDKLTLLVDDDIVHIPVLGLIPYCDLEIQSEVNFGEMIANSKLVTKQISISNRGTIAGVFKISYDGVVLLNIKPLRGVVKPKSTRKIRVDVCTDVPGVIKEMMKVELESRGCTEVWVRGVVVEQVLKVLGVNCGKVLKCINFGPLYFGTSKTEQIYLYNESPECMDWVAVLEDNAIGGEMGTDLQGSTDAVLYDLSLKTKDVDVSTLILCAPNQGTLEPYEKSLITVCFSPKKFERDFEVNDASPVQDYVVFLRFETAGKRGDSLQNLSGGATATTSSDSRYVDLALMGSGFPVILTFKPGTEINFEDCYLGEKTQVACTMKNESEFLPVAFRFRKTAHFSVSPARGNIETKSEKEVMISFSPHQIGKFEMKQIIDIIGTGVDKKNVDVLKTKPFHQIYLTLHAVCKSKQASIVFTINPGLTPLISNETGQFVARGRGQLRDTAPVAILKSIRTQIHTHRKNRNREDGALIAFPNDRAASLRPSDWNKKYRTIFTKTERYNYVDPEFALTDSERLLKEENNKHYVQFISHLRQRRLEREAARHFYFYNNPVSLGIKPAEGLKSPDISVTDFPMEKPQPETLPSDDNCMLTSRKLAEIVSKSTNKGVWSWLSPMPTSPQEKEDCSLTLTHKQLHQIFIGPSTIDFGDVCVYSTTTKELHIINNLSVHIWIQVEIEVAELQETSPLSQVVPPLTKTHIPVVFETINAGMFKNSFSYKINNKHIGHVLVIAHAKPIELQLSRREVILSPVSGCLAGTEFRRTVRVCNPRNQPAGFIWKPVDEDTKSAFTIQPARGFVEPYSEVECEVVWHPGFSTPETGQFTLSVRKGNSVNLKCSAKFGTTRVQFVAQSVSLAHSPIGFTTCKTATILNTGHHHAYFQVLDSNPLPGMKITPSEGVIPVGGFVDLKISFTPKAHMSFDKKVEVAVRNAAELTLRISGFSEITEIGIDVGIFEYQGVYVGSTKSIPFLLQNKGQSCTRVQFDFIDHKDFKLYAEDNSAIDRSRSKPYLYTVYLKEESSLQCFLTFTPKRVAAYDFILPIAVPRATYPTPAPAAPLKRGAPAPLPPPESPALPVCRVRAHGLQPLVEFSSMEFKFEAHLSDMRSSTADRSVSSQNLVLKCLAREDVMWKLNFDDVDKNIEDGVFRFSQKHGRVCKKQEASIAMSFWPPSPGTYTSEIILHLNNNPARYILTLSGTLRSPKMDFHPPFLMLMPVPLDVETEADVTIIPQDFLRDSQIRVKLPELELADGTRTCPFFVEFPEGENVVLSSDGTANELTCRISFSSSKPMSFLGEMLFIDQEDNRFSFQVAGTADNCLLTLYPFLALHSSDQKIIWRSNNIDFSIGEVVLQPCFTPASPSHTHSTSSLGANSGSSCEDSESETTTDEGESDEYESEENEEASEESKTVSESDEKGDKCELSFFPDEDEEDYMFFQKTLNAVQSWFTLFGWPKGQNPISIPYSLRSDVCIVQLTVAQEKNFKRRVDKDKGFYEMLVHLNGQSISGIAASQSLSTDPVERMLQLHWQHTELLSFLKRKGAYLPHIMPEFLLSPEDYELWSEVNTGVRCFVPEAKRGTMRSPGKLSGRRIFVLESQTFETMSKRAWTDVLLQMYKVFVLPRVSSRIVPDPSSLECLQNIPGIKSEPLCSNIYSRYERTILIWLNKNYEKNRKIVWKDNERGGIPPMRWIVNFDQDLLDGLVLAAQMAGYCPYLIPTHFVKMYTNPITHEQFMHNALILVKALHTINMDLDIKAIDICDPNPVMMLILCVHLYDILPHYLPKNTIEFSGALHATIVKQVVLKNPSNYALAYNVILVGRDAHDFSLPKGNTVTIPDGRQGFVNVEFTIRFLHPAEAVLLLISNKVDGIDGATMAFSLKAEVKSIEPLAIIRCRSPCYELKKFSINVTNPFKTDGIFRVLLLESTHLIHPEKVYQVRQEKQEQKFSFESSILNSKNSVLSEDSKKETFSDQSSLLHEFFSPMENLFLRGKDSASLDIHFLPFNQEKRYCTLILINEKIGEFVYLIEGSGDLPLTSELPTLDSPNVLHATSEDECTAHPVLYLKCVLGQTLEENLKIPVINEPRERALALAAQQQMSAEEYERRLMTGTLQSSSVRVATALLGLSGVERRALLKPRRHPSEMKHVDYSVELSIKHVFEVPKKFSIPVLSSARVVLDPPSAKYPTSQKTGGIDAVEFPIKFTPKKPGCYHCQIILKSSCDIRVYEIECVVNEDQADAQLEFLIPAYQTVTQEIPISNLSSEDWRFEAILEGQGFHGPPAINVPVGGTVPYPLTFRPIAENVIMGRLILRNVTAGTQNIFSLKGIGKKPLPQDCIVIECQVGKVAHKILWVHNYTKKMLKYKVYSNLSMLSGAPDVAVNPEDTAAYTLSISPCRRGVFQGVISFVAEDEDQQQPQGSSSAQRTDGKGALQKLPARTPDADDIGGSSTNCKVWFSLKIFSAPAAAERTIDVDCKALDTVGINIPITNPTNKVLKMSVLLDHPSLFGENSFILKPKQTFSYHLQFSAAAVGAFAGSVMFRSDVVGEFWYALKFNVEKPSPAALPDIGCELGKWTLTHLPLTNPTNDTLVLQVVNSDPCHFAVETDPTQLLAIPPHSTSQLPVRFCPSALGRRNHKATITFKCPQFGERIFHLTGSGVPPERMETTTTSACIGEYSSAIISFRNPTAENVVVDIVLADQGLLNERLSASVLSQATCEESVFHLLVKQPQGIRLAPKEKLEIPVLFMPAEMKIYKAVVVIHVMRGNGENWPYEVTGESNRDLNRNVIVAENGETQGILWIYPINGTPEAPQQKSVVIRCQARQRLEQRVELLLIGVMPGATDLPDAGNSASVDTEEVSSTPEVTDGSSATLEFLYELQYQSDEIRYQLESLVGMELVEKEWDTESRIVTLIFNVVFAPSKPMRSEATLVIQCTAGGLWKFPLVFIATEPEVDDVINIEAVGLNKESIVGFKLTSQTRYPEPFTAHFLAGSDPDFLVMPQAGELLPEGTGGTHITVGYKPRMYGRKHTATLVIETQSMQWTYIINGLPPQTEPPTAAAKVVCTSSYRGSFTVRQRNFVRENLKLITTGASSPIKGAPLVLRNRQKKL
ncbi:cilia- and flagella-associated protein 47 [Melospiza georgiana]|uniref:cilia- and flagella-associated protein 47 n=1 Tax=Melospiza georgiana TaxID=44398 RepID=UPI0025ACAC0E|nr:cilia- and flagella-associated protein 47 [Melospiza georgiana]